MDHYTKTLNPDGTISVVDNLEVATAQLADIANKLIDVKHPPKHLNAAKGDGITDDTEAINSMVQYVQANKLGGLYFPDSDNSYMIKAEGTDEYATDGGIIINSPMKIILHPNATLEAILNDKQRYKIINIKNTSDVFVSGGKIKGERTNHVSADPTNDGGQWGYGIYVTNCNRVWIEDVLVTDCWGDGLITSIGCSDIYVKRVKCDNNRRQGYSITGGNNIYILNCEFSNTNGQMPQSGIDIENDPGNTNPKNVFISKCKFEGNYTGILLGNTCENIIIEGNIFKDNEHSAIELTGEITKVNILNNIIDMDIINTNNGILLSSGLPKNINIIGNKIKNSANGAGIAMFIGSSDININNNEIYNCKMGVSFANISPSNIEISDNNIHDISTYCIYPNIALLDSKINNNNLRDSSWGIYIRMTRCNIQNNVIKNMQKKGIGGTAPISCLISGNTLIDCGLDTSVTYHSIDLDGSSSDNYVTNNYIRNPNISHIAINSYLEPIIPNIITKNNCIYDSVNAITVHVNNIKIDNFINANSYIGTLTWDPGILSDGVGETSPTITVTGARMGDFVVVAAPYDLQGITVTGYVATSNAVKIRILNQTGSTVDLASGDWKVKIIKNL